MRASDHRHTLVALRQRHEDAGQPAHLLHQLQQRPLGEEPQIDSHLVVAAARRVHPLTQRAQRRRQAPLHRQMDVLILGGDLEGAAPRAAHDPNQFALDRVAFLRRETDRLHRQFRQHGHMGRRADTIHLD